MSTLKHSNSIPENSSDTLIPIATYRTNSEVSQDFVSQKEHVAPAEPINQDLGPTSYPDYVSISLLKGSSPQLQHGNAFEFKGQRANAQVESASTPSVSAASTSASSSKKLQVSQKSNHIRLV